MSHKRKGQLTVSGEWAKHLRKFWRRQFWKGERAAGRKMIKIETESKLLTMIIERTGNEVIIRLPATVDTKRL